MSAGVCDNPGDRTAGRYRHSLCCDSSADSDFGIFGVFGNCAVSQISLPHLADFAGRCSSLVLLAFL